MDWLCRGFTHGNGGYVGLALELDDQISARGDVTGVSTVAQQGECRVINADLNAFSAIEGQRLQILIVRIDMELNRRSGGRIGCIGYYAQTEEFSQVSVKERIGAHGAVDRYLSGGESALPGAEFIDGTIEDRVGTVHGAAEIAVSHRSDLNRVVADILDFSHLDAVHIDTAQVGIGQERHDNVHFLAHGHRIAGAIDALLGTALTGGDEVGRSRAHSSVIGSQEHVFGSGVSGFITEVPDASPGVQGVEFDPGFHRNRFMVGDQVRREPYVRRIIGLGVVSGTGDHQVTAFDGGRAGQRSVRAGD